METSEQSGINAEGVLRPYLHLALTELHSPPAPSEVFSTFYIKHLRSPTSEQLASLKDKNVFFSHPLPTHIATNGDTAAVAAETLFREALRALGNTEADTIDFWPPLPVEDDDDIIA